jgi:hypothetical protein
MKSCARWRDRYKGKEEGKEKGSSAPWRGRRVRGLGRRRGGGRARERRWRRGCRARRGRGGSVDEGGGVSREESRERREGKQTHLIHLCQSPFLHLLQRHDLIRLLMPRKVHLSIPTLSNLRHNMEHLQLQLCPPLPEKNAFPPRVGLPFRLDLRTGHGRAGVDGFFEGLEARFALGEVGEVVEVMIVKDCERK